jgi:tetratricopeptide (TPR) repeat protein
MLMLRLAIGCAYGLVALFAFTKAERLCNTVYVQLAYATGFLALLIWTLHGVRLEFGRLSPGNLLAVGFWGMGSGLLISLFNLPTIKCVAGGMISNFARAATGDDALVVRKQYGRAAGAEARGELAEAAELYREEIRKDPKDADVHLLLAEVLLKQNLPNGALEEFQTGVGMMKEKRDRAAALFRLGEVFDEELNRPAAAREVADRIARECPGTPFAAHARKRWGS